MRDKLISHGAISEEDFDLILLTDSVDEVVRVMNRHREQKIKHIERTQAEKLKNSK